MTESFHEQNNDLSDYELAEEAATTLPENNAYFRLRRTALISSVILIIMILITLLYLNGKSLYEHGL